MTFCRAFGRCTGLLSRGKVVPTTLKLRRWANATSLVRGANLHIWTCKSPSMEIAMSILGHGMCPYMEIAVSIHGHDLSPYMEIVLSIYGHGRPLGRTIASGWESNCWHSRGVIIFAIILFVLREGNHIGHRTGEVDGSRAYGRAKVPRKAKKEMPGEPGSSLITTSAYSLVVLRCVSMIQYLCLECQ